jgi:hypothetical protein
MGCTGAKQKQKQNRNIAISISTPPIAQHCDKKNQSLIIDTLYRLEFINPIVSIILEFLSLSLPLAEPLYHPPNGVLLWVVRSKEVPRKTYWLYHDPLDLSMYGKIAFLLISQGQIDEDIRTPICYKDSTISDLVSFAIVNATG